MPQSLRILLLYYGTYIQYCIVRVQEIHTITSDRALHFLKVPCSRYSTASYAWLFCAQSPLVPYTYERALFPLIRYCPNAIPRRRRESPLCSWLGLRNGPRASLLSGKCAWSGWGCMILHIISSWHKLAVRTLLNEKEVLHITRWIDEQSEGCMTDISLSH